jgi:hypothetical protein
MAIVGNRHTSGRTNDAESDLAMLKQFLDVAQGLV